MRSEINKPRICEVLGVEVGEEFQIGDIGCSFWIDESGQANSELYDRNKSSFWILKAINNKEMITRKPPLTEKELDICNASGALWITRDQVKGGGESYVQLWRAKPIATYKRGNRGDELTYGGQNVVGLLDAALFPSMKPGEIKAIREVNKA